MSLNIDQSRSFLPSQSKDDHCDSLGRTLMIPSENSSRSQILTASDNRKNDINELNSQLDVLQSDQDLQQKQTLSKESNSQIIHHQFIDSDTKSITEKMDLWYLDMKKNLMNEVEKLRLQYIEEAQQNTLHEKENQIKEYVRLNEDIKLMREMLLHYEHTIDQKDQVENNLNKAIDLLSNKTLVYQNYYEWRIQYNERRQEKHLLRLAKRFYEMKLKQKILINWKRIIEREWRKNFELACEKNTQAVLKTLRDEYELKYKQLELQLLNANEEIARLKMDKNTYDEPLKKAFMRGVCALNMEAMSVLFKNGHDSDTTIVHERQHREYHKRKDNDSIDEQSVNEDITITTLSTTDDEESRLRHLSHRHTCPTRVYKEYLPSAIDTIRDGRFIRSSSRHRRSNSSKRQATSQSRFMNSNVLVERNGQTNNICS